MLTFMLVPLATAASLVAPPGNLVTRWPSIGDQVVRPGDAEVATQGAALAGSWRLSWDDAVGEKLTGEVKTCDLSFQQVDGQLSGKFLGPVAGRVRDAILQGTLHDTPNGKLLLFQQRESGYLCSYQLAWSANSNGVTSAVGVWHDTHGRSGNFTLLKYQ